MILDRPVRSRAGCVCGDLEPLVARVFDGMGNSSEQLAHEIALMVGDPVYRQNWFDMLMWA